MSSIYDLLPEGQKNALSRRELIALTGMSDRALRKAIADERRAGALILSNVEYGRSGYFRPAPGNAGELRRYIASMTSRGRKTFAVLKAAKAALAEIEQNEAKEGGEDADTV